MQHVASIYIVPFLGEGMEVSTLQGDGASVVSEAYSDKAQSLGGSVRRIYRHKGDMLSFYSDSHFRYLINRQIIISKFGQIALSWSSDHVIRKNCCLTVHGNHPSEPLPSAGRQKTLSHLNVWVTSNRWSSEKPESLKCLSHLPTAGH